MVFQDTIKILTKGRETIELTTEVDEIVRRSKIREGICNVFIQHTSASLILCENADPSVRVDLESFMEQLVRDGDPRFRHDTEGPDDMPAHIRSILTDSNISLPVCNGSCMLGMWQGIYIWEHRYSPHKRKIIVTIYGG
jgi:secondary thiamine-phosphate synthase enzyme